MELFNLSPLVLKWKKIINQQINVICNFTSTVLTSADESHHIDKHKFTVPFVCGARDLGEALRRIAEGAAMIRTKGQAGTGEN